MFLNNVDLLLGSWFLSVLFCFFISMYKIFFLINTFQFFLKSLVSSLVLHISTLQRPPVSLKSFISITQHVQCHTSNNQPTKKKKKSSGLLWAGQAEGTGHLQKDRLFYLYIKKVTVATMQTFTHRNKQPPSSQWTSKTTGSLFIPFTTNEVKLKQHWYLTVLCAVLL